MEFVRYDKELNKFINDFNNVYETKEEFIQCGIFEFCGWGETTRN
jgi:hypothetical protein